MKIGSQSVPNLGMGTWYLGEGDAQQNTQEIAALRYGIEHGINVIDTAEMYGQGAAESLVGQAIIPYQREQLFLISKFYPWHATLNTMRTALKNSLIYTCVATISTVLLSLAAAFGLAKFPFKSVKFFTWALLSDSCLRFTQS